MSTLAAQKQTTQSVLAAYNAWDIDAILAFRAPDCRQQVLPASMGQNSLTNEEYRERMGHIMPLFRKFTVILPFHVSFLESQAKAAIGYRRHRGSRYREEDMYYACDEYSRNGYWTVCE
jgi:hypothetical protein